MFVDGEKGKRLQFNICSSWIYSIHPPDDVKITFENLTNSFRMCFENRKIHWIQEA